MSLFRVPVNQHPDKDSDSFVFNEMWMHYTKKYGYNHAMEDDYKIIRDNEFISKFDVNKYGWTAVYFESEEAYMMMRLKYAGTHG